MDPRPTCRVAGSACVPELGRVPRVLSPRSPPARLPAKATGLPTAAVHRPSSPTVRELWLIGDPPALHAFYMADLTPSAACVTVMSSLSRAHQAFAPPEQPDESALAVSGWDTQNCICLPTRSPAASYSFGIFEPARRLRGSSFEIWDLPRQDVRPHFAVPIAMRCAFSRNKGREACEKQS